MTVPANGHGPAAAGSITRTPSFAPITPVVRERVGEVAARLSEVEQTIEEMNRQSATDTTRSPTMGELKQEIDLLKKDIETTRSAQGKQIDDLRSDVKNDVKQQITKATRNQIERKIMESIQAQVKIEVEELGQSTGMKRFVENLKNMAEENEVLFQEARVKLDNSRSRHENSTLDEQADFETKLSKILLPDGDASELYPQTLKHLFSYDDHQLLQLLDEYGLRRLNTHLENLNRFLAFIGLRFSILEQSPDFLDRPPAYPHNNGLESPEEGKPLKVLPVSPPDQGKEKTEAMPEVKPEREEPQPQEPAATNTHPLKVQAQEKQQDETQPEEQREAQHDRGGQKPPGIELSPLPRQPPVTPTNQHPQPPAPTFPARSINRNPSVSRTVQPPPQSRPVQSPNVNPQGSEPSVGSWLKSLAGR